MRDLLVSVQIALCVVLVLTAGLVLRTLESTTRVDAGFETSRTLASYVSTSSMGVPVEERHRFFEDLIRRFEALPWVDAATVAEYAPLSAHPSQELLPSFGSEAIAATVARVWRGYFDAMEMDVIRGRSFVPADSVGASAVVVVNQSFAGLLAPDGDATGQILTWPARGDEPERRIEVVGIVRDARQVTLLDDPGPVAYFALQQEYSRPGNALLVKTIGDATVVADNMRQELRAVDTRLAIVNILPYRDVVRGSLYTQRMNAELFTAIALLALLLSSAGVFAVVALSVAARRRELGIRIAIGAGRSAIMRSVLTRIGGSVLIGVGAGVGGSFVAARWIGSLLWGVGPTDPWALGVGIGVLAVALALAVQLPLRRALRIDPARSLQMD